MGTRNPEGGRGTDGGKKRGGVFCRCHRTVTQKERELEQARGKEEQNEKEKRRKIEKFGGTMTHSINPVSVIPLVWRNVCSVRNSSSGKVKSQNEADVQTLANSLDTAQGELRFRVVKYSFIVVKGSLALH